MANDLISRNALASAVEESQANNPHPLSRDKVMHNHEHRHFLKLIYDAPTVDAVVIPDCSKCFYSDRIEHWQKCDCCIGSKHEDNFLSKEEVEDGR